MSGKSVLFARFTRLAHTATSLLCPIVLLWSTALFAAEPTDSFTPEQLTALKSLDAALARFDADLERVANPGERARVEAVLETFKTRRDAMRQVRFDQVRYDELRFDLNVEYQRLGRFLAPLNTPSDGKPTPAKREILDLRLTLLPVPAGTFVLGRPQGTSETDYPDENPATRVTFTKPFWLGATEVTVGQWKYFVAATNHRTDAEKEGGLFVPKNANASAGNAWEKRAGLSWRNPPHEQTDEHPVVGVTWADAQAFCAWLNDRERSAGRLPAGYAYSLPTAPQWEYACRAGNRGPDPENLDAWVWHARNSQQVPHPVGMKRPNAWGFFDLQGNVAEWCLDWHAPYPGGHVIDPAAPAEGKLREQRGGTARSSGHDLASTHRAAAAPSPRDDLGFRVALVPAR